MKQNISIWRCFLEYEYVVCAVYYFKFKSQFNIDELIIKKNSNINY